MKTLLHTLTCAALALTLAVPAEAEKRKRFKHLRSNVTAEGITDLLDGIAHVGFSGALQNKNGTNYNAISIKWFGRDGKTFTCSTNTRSKTYEASSAKHIGVLHDNTFRKEKYPLIQYKHPDRDGYHAIIHAPDGGTGLYTYWKKYWWEDALGHLQKRLPAAVWEACPDFPSAKSLGAKVNHKQTALKYFDLLKQDRGDRVMRPDLITKDTVEKY